MRIKQIFFSIFIFSCLVQNTSADTIRLKSGRIVEGKIVLESSVFVRILTNEKIKSQEFLNENIQTITKGEASSNVKAKILENEEPKESTIENSLSQSLSTILEVSSEKQMLESLPTVESTADSMLIDGLLTIPVIKQKAPLFENIQLIGKSLKVLGSEHSNADDLHTISQLDHGSTVKPVAVKLSNNVSTGLFEVHKTVAPVEPISRVQDVVEIKKETVKVTDSVQSSVFANQLEKSSTPKSVNNPESLKSSPEQKDHPVKPQLSAPVKKKVEIPLVHETIKIPFIHFLLPLIIYLLVVLLLRVGKKKRKLKKSPLQETPVKEPEVKSATGLQSQLNRLTSQIQAKSQAHEQQNFWDEAADAFVFPFRKSIVFYFMFVICAYLIINMAMFVPILTVPMMVVFFIFSIVFMVKIVQTAALSPKQNTFEWPNFLHLFEWLGKLFLIFLSVVIWFGPVGGYFFKFAQAPDAIILSFFTLSLFVWPMGFLAISVAGGIFSLNPILLIKSIMVSSGAYLFTVVVLLAFAGLNLFLCLTELAFIPVLGKTVKWFIFVYSLFITMQLLGVFYRTHKSQLNWFPEKKKDQGGLVHTSDSY